MTITANITNAYAEILTSEATEFLVQLHRQFDAERQSLLAKREERQAAIDAGTLPDFLSETKEIRESDWTVAKLPEDLLDRRVEITGPVDRKMIINALNSGANMFMADLEDSNSPSWKNIIEGQINLRDAVRRTISFTNPKNGKEYSLNDEVATLLVRPRGWHLLEKNILVDCEPMSGSLVDFGLYFFHNAKYLLENGSGPYFYLPKMESHLEARLWNKVFVFAQDHLNIPQGSIKATVLIETILASFELHEILYELREHSAGLNCGRWDYIFSFIKRFRNRPGFVLPDRSQVTMSVSFMRAYSLLVIQTCHRRGVHAMGGMAAQIPIKNDEEANQRAIEKVRQDKLTEVQNGHDGTWVAHPGLVSVAKEIFDEHMPTENQIGKKRDDLTIQATDLIELPEGTITENGLRMNINVGILYVESWLRGNGAAAIYHLMEDAATAEISRTQIWQWIKNEAKLDDGRTITYELYEQLKAEELEEIKDYLGKEAYHQGRFPEAIDIFDRLVYSKDFIEFLTVPAYELI
ncbi:malate synthase A [Tunicatimonas pelagia]|nr:malate synthase A [Tunicatimonas pelagia]WKN46387.1 malate synthase A [Tunicatimonas pelagia]